MSSELQSAGSGGKAFGAMGVESGREAPVGDRAHDGRWGRQWEEDTTLGER